MPRDTVAEIKDRLSIADVVGPYVKLARAGKSLKGLCPFHKEKTPSFHVSPERGTWHCFGCGAGGDMFSFIEKAEGVDFRGALALLAEKAGVEIVRDPRASEHRSRQERLYAALARAVEWYAEKLPASPAQAYARKRGLAAETIESWRLGYAPDAWRALLEALAAEGFSTDELLAAGLVKEADGKKGTYYDRFRNRLMFPIRDAAGRAIAFTGRTLGSGDEAKYLNSPETELYRKSDVLFGIDRAKDAIRARGFTLLVEGQMDVLLAHQAGFGNAVALSGTALTERHLALMKRYSENLMLVLDADAAGLAATAKSAALALRGGLRVKAAPLPAGKDPADLIGENPKEFAERVKAAKPVVEFFLAALAERERDPHRLVRAAEAVVLPLIGALTSPLERAHFAQVTARSLGLSEEAVRESLARVPRSPAPPPAPRAAEAPPPGKTPRQNREGQLFALFHAYPGTPLAERIAAEYRRITEATLPPDAPAEQALFLAEELAGEEPLENAADELLRAFEEAVIREAYQEAVAGLRRAEAAGDAARVEKAQEQCAKLSARIALLGR